MLPELEKKIDLMQIDDMDVESFRDVILDAVIDDAYSKLVPPGETITFRGNAASEFTAHECSLKVISHEHIAKNIDLSETMQASLKFYDVDVLKRDLLHSKFLLNMRAEHNIKIDIIWNMSRQEDSEFSNYFTAISCYFEDSGTSCDDEGKPAYDPRDNAFWDEFLIDFGIAEDPYSDEELAEYEK